MGLQGKRIVLGVSGGIAAYKAIEVCRQLVEAGSFVSPIMTESAMKMVGPTTFSALASEPVLSSFWGSSDVIPHTRLGQQADLVLVCPATARSISDLRTGRSADLLTATLISTVAPVVVCPAMHTEMWNSDPVQENISVLRSRRISIVGPGDGPLAGGDSGPGRLADVAEIIDAVTKLVNFSKNLLGVDGQDFAGLRVLVTAGGTREPIDPVRFISNRSSGKQGHALAECAASRGAEVSLVTASSLPANGVSTRVQVETAEEMGQAVQRFRGTSDVILMSAAVSDYRVKSVAVNKLKKADGPPQIELIPNKDILAALAIDKPQGQIVVGFAAETDDVQTNAAKKIEKKQADIIVANDVSAPGVGFDHSTNAVTIVESGGTRHKVGLVSKREVASAVLDVINTMINAPKKESRE